MSFCEPAFLGVQGIQTRCGSAQPFTSRIKLWSLQQVQVTRVGLSSGPAAQPPVAPPVGRVAEGQGTLERSLHHQHEHPGSVLVPISLAGVKAAPSGPGDQGSLWWHCLITLKPFGWSGNKASPLPFAGWELEARSPKQPLRGPSADLSPSPKHTSDVHGSSQDMRDTGCFQCFSCLLFPWGKGKASAPTRVEKFFALCQVPDPPPHSQVEAPSFLVSI